MTASDTTNLAIGYRQTRKDTTADCLTTEQMPIPTPTGQDILVHIQAVSVNPVDTKQRLLDSDEPFRILGYDAAGIVIAIGEDVTLFKPGDEVYYAGQYDRPGSNQTYQLVDQRIVAKKPHQLTYAQAASLPLTALTAWESLFDHLALNTHSEGTLLVVGATGGVGSILLQLVKALLPKITIIATASDTERIQWVTQLGASHTVNHHQDLKPQIIQHAPDGVDWIFTIDATDQLPLYESILKPFGKIVGLTAKHLDVTILKNKSISWHWELMFTRPVYQTPDMIEQHNILQSVAELVDTGQIRHTATQILTPINTANIVQAHQSIETGHTIGKIVIAHTTD